MGAVSVGGPMSAHTLQGSEKQGVMVHFMCLLALATGPRHLIKYHFLKMRFTFKLIDFE